MKYDKTQQRIDSSNKLKQLHRKAHIAQQASAKLKPLDWADRELGIRRVDVDIFKAAALAFNHMILVRATNTPSLPYIGNKNMYPKPIDCKVKTADYDVAIPFASRHIYSKTAGLVADPTIVGAKAFKDNKYEVALREWDNFLKDKSPDEKKAKVFRRRGALSGCYAVDLDINSEYYGCLMISRSNDIARRIVDGQTIATTEGSSKFDETALRANSAWRRANIWDNQANEYKTRMQYMHGDYDLYALIDLDDINAPTETEWINGVKSLSGKKFPEIQEFVNRGIGVPMLQHGDQFRYAHKGDTVYVFDPIGSVYVINSKASAEPLKQIFDILYGVN